MHRLFLFLILCIIGTAALSSEQKPDILIFLCDDFNPFYTGISGDPDAETPHLDSLAKESATFTRCYSASTVCMPARTSLVTGLYPHDTGCWGNSNSLFVPPPLTTLFSDFKATGYQTAMIGKTHWFSGPEYKREFDTPEDYFHGIGIDYVQEVATTFGSRNGEGIYQDYLRSIKKFQSQSKDLTRRLKENQYAACPSLLQPQETCDWMMTDLAIEYLDNTPNTDPFFLMIGYSNPHSPMDPSGKYSTQYTPEDIELRPNTKTFSKYGTDYDEAEIRKTRAAYLGKISFLDDQLGRLIARLKDRGTWDNTILVFTADHGLTVGEHANISKGRFWEEIARVPMVIRIPGVTDAGFQTDSLAQLFDIYPTLIEAAGGKPSPHLSAKSLMPVLKNPDAEVRDAVFSEIQHKGKFNYLVSEKRFKWTIQDGKEALFDLEKDPYEMKNLISSKVHTNKANELKDRLRKFLMEEQLSFSEGYVPLAERVKKKESED